jgi:hypothetical protein
MALVSARATGDVSAASHQAAATAKTYLFVGKKQVGQLVQDSPGSRVYDVLTLDGEGVGYVSILRNGSVLVGDSYTAFANGYARPRPGGTWNVNAYFKGGITSFGTVRRRDAGTWIAYHGTGSKARRVGFATGPHADLGAVAVLLVSGF